MEWFIALLIVLPALFMAASRSSYLLDYVFFVVALNRGIRRLVDYYFNEAFNPMSPISLTQLIVSVLLLVPALSRMNQLTPRVRGIAMLIMLALAHGTAVGVLNAGIGAFYSPGAQTWFNASRQRGATYACHRNWPSWTGLTC